MGLEIKDPRTSTQDKLNHFQSHRNPHISPISKICNCIEILIGLKHTYSIGGKWLIPRSNVFPVLDKACLGVSFVSKVDETFTGRSPLVVHTEVNPVIWTWAQWIMLPVSKVLLCAIANMNNRRKKSWSWRLNQRVLICTQVVSNQKADA